MQFQRNRSVPRGMKEWASDCGRYRVVWYAMYDGIRVSPARYTALVRARRDDGAEYWDFVVPHRHHRKLKAALRLCEAHAQGNGNVAAARSVSLIERTETMSAKKTTKTATKAKTAKATKKAKADAPAKAAKTPKARKPKAEGKLSAIDAAAKVLADNGEPMNCKELIDVMATKGLWKSPGGATPHTTLYSAILRELNAKGKEARFVKTERGKFAANNA